MVTVPTGRLRPIALAIIRNGDRILVFEGYDPSKRERFFRPLGGGIEFGEYGRDALLREIREELGADIGEPRFLGALENIFTYDGRPGHEIVLVYETAFTDPSWYERESLEGVRLTGAPSARTGSRSRSSSGVPTRSTRRASWTSCPASS